MADYKSKFSFIIPTEGKDPQDFIDFMDALNDEAETPFDDPNSAKVEGWPDPAETMRLFDFNIGFDVSFDPDKNPANPAIWITDQGGMPNLDLLVYVVELACEKMELQNPVVIEWANTCSRPLLDGFGGGIAVIARDADGKIQSRTQSTNNMDSALIAEIAGSRLEIDEPDAPGAGGMM